MKRSLWALTSIGLAVVIGILAVNTRVLTTGASGAMVVKPPPPSTRAASTEAADVQDGDYTGTIVQLGPSRVAPGSGKIVLNIRLPQGYKFNDSAPFSMHVNRNDVVTVAPADNDLSIVLPTMPVAMPVTFHQGQATLKIDVNVFYCEAVNESRCYPAQLRLELPVTVSTGSKPELIVDYLITPPVGLGNSQP